MPVNASPIEAPPAIRETGATSPDRFRAEVVSRGEPAVLRGAARDWPLVMAALDDPHRCMAMLAARANGEQADILRADPDQGGRFHYRDGEETLNFIRGRGNLAGLLAGLAQQEGAERPYAMAAQGLVADEYVPGFSTAHPMPLVPDSCRPRLWIGNAAKTATHNDPIDNLAVVVAGRRRFTLFPPGAEPNLYMGPKHPTPAGTPVSMVHVTAPDLARYPLYSSALEQAQQAELLPGDAIFIPRDWFHHVESLAQFNMLVNYWWEADRGASNE